MVFLYRYRKRLGGNKKRKKLGKSFSFQGTLHAIRWRLWGNRCLHTLEVEALKTLGWQCHQKTTITGWWPPLRLSYWPSPAAPRTAFLCECQASCCVSVKSTRLVAGCDIIWCFDSVSAKLKSRNIFNPHTRRKKNKKINHFANITVRDFLTNLVDRVEEIKRAGRGSGRCALGIVSLPLTRGRRGWQLWRGACIWIAWEGTRWGSDWGGLRSSEGGFDMPHTSSSPAPPPLPPNPWRRGDQSGVLFCIFDDGQTRQGAGATSGAERLHRHRVSPTSRLDITIGSGPRGRHLGCFLTAIWTAKFFSFLTVTTLIGQTGIKWNVSQVTSKSPPPSPMKRDFFDLFTLPSHKSFLSSVTFSRRVLSSVESVTVGKLNKQTV